MNEVIHRIAHLRCDVHQAFQMFTSNDLLKQWFPVEADVEPVIGGRYELFWDPEDRENNSTIGCRVTAVVEDELLAFEWKGPVQFKHFMNVADPLTHVCVIFFPSEKRGQKHTEVHVIHSGWRSSGEWQEAKQWFERAWSEELEHLTRLINGE